MDRGYAYLVLVNSTSVICPGPSLGKVFRYKAKASEALLCVAKVMRSAISRFVVVCSWCLINVAIGADLS